jgi:hypothetical protein
MFYSFSSILVDPDSYASGQIFVCMLTRFSSNMERTEYCYILLCLPRVFIRITYSWSAYDFCSLLCGKSSMRSVLLA